MQQVGNDFLRWNNALTKLNAPKLQKVGDYFLFHNSTLTELKVLDYPEVGGDLNFNIRVTKISPKDIAHLDRDTRLFSGEVTSVGRFLERLKGRLKRIFKRNGKKVNTGEQDIK